MRECYEQKPERWIFVFSARFELTFEKYIVKIFCRKIGGNGATIPHLRHLRKIGVTCAKNTRNIREDLYPTIQIARVLNEIHDRCITERSAYYIVRSKGQIEKEGAWVSNKGKHRQKDKHTDKDKDRNIKRLVYARYVRLHNPYRQYTNLFIFRFVSEHYVYSAHYVYFIQIKHLYKFWFYSYIIDIAWLRNSDNVINTTKLQKMALSF